MVGWKPPSCGPRDHKPEAKAAMATASKNNLTGVHISFSHPSNTNYRESPNNRSWESSTCTPVCKYRHCRSCACIHFTRTTRRRIRLNGPISGGQTCKGNLNRTGARDNGYIAFN